MDILFLNKLKEIEAVCCFLPEVRITFYNDQILIACPYEPPAFVDIKSDGSISFLTIYPRWPLCSPLEAF